jgi:PAS domain S-box-containing protein
MSSLSNATPSSSDVIASDAMILLRDHVTQVLNAIDDGVFFLDDRGHVTFVNEAAARLIGFTNRELMGQSMHELTHHHYADGTLFPVEECPILSSVTDGVQQRVGGDVFWTKSGAPIAVDYTSIPVKKGRTVIGVVVTFRDSSNEQRVEELSARLKSERAANEAAERARAALAESERRYHFLAEAIPVQVWTARADGTLDSVTQRVAEYFGRSVEQLLGEGWLDVTHPDDLPEAIARWTAALATGTPYEVRFRLRDATGNYRWHLGRALPQHSDRGEVVRWFGTNTDIDDQVRSAT